MEREGRPEEKQWSREIGRIQGTRGQQGEQRISLKFNRSEGVEKKKIKELC